MRGICSGGLNLSSRHVTIGLASEYQAVVPPRSSPLGKLSRAKRSQREERQLYSQAAIG